MSLLLIITLLLDDIYDYSYYLESIRLSLLLVAKASRRSVGPHENMHNM